MKILLAGAKGRLASSLCRALYGHDVTALGRDDLDICDAVAVRSQVAAVAPDVVINAAAVRRPDECELNPERAFAVNTLGARNLAVAAAEQGSAFVQISTDNVFDGSKSMPYVEEDSTNPITTYGVSKLAAELLVRNITPRHFIIRTSGLFGEGADARGSDFVLTMLRVAREGAEARVAEDQFIAPSYTPDIAAKVATLIGTESYGVYHVVNSGSCSWYEFARAIFNLAAVDVRLMAVTTDQLQLRAPRLRNGVLTNARLRRMGTDDLPAWYDALQRYMIVLRHSGVAA